jgi:hypothetical protein
MKTITNHDYARITKTTQFDMLPNGFLPVTANLTRTGIFTYYEMQKDGSVKTVRQLRHPDEVFSADAMGTLLGLPATNNHPSSSLISVENAKNYVVGWQAEAPTKVKLDDMTKDGEDYIQSKIVFFDRKTIDAITGGKKQEISLGYVCNLDETPGEWNGQKYDSIQRNIRYNHLSLVDKARGGEACRIMTDADSLNVLCDGISFPDEVFMEGKLTIDAEEYQGLVKEKEKLQAQCDELNAKVKEFSVFDAESFKKTIKERVALEKRASTILDGMKLEDMAERDIQEAVIKKLRPDAVLDGKSDDYIAARFDIAIEDGFKNAPKKSEQTMSAAILNNQDSDDWQTLAEKKRTAMIQASKNLYKR